MARILDMAYSTTWVQLAICLLPLGGQQRATTELWWAMILSLAVILPISGIWPAQNAWVAHGLTAQVPPEAQHWHSTLLSLRAGTLASIDPTFIEGLVTFPSFHTTMGLLLPWALRRYRVVVPLACALNALMLLSVPTQGRHYGVDMLAGAVVALGACWGARRLCREDE